MFDLNGKRALVTGASGGIGAAIAKAFADAGAHVALSGTRAEKLAAVQSELGAKTAVTPADLSNPEAPAALVAAAEDALGGGLDIVVSNAGLTRDGLLLRMKDADWETVMRVNLDAYFRLARACLKGMMKRRFGRVIGISSVVGHTGNPGQANYVAAKAGMTGFTKALALEVASRGVTANCIAPGFIETAMTDALNEDQRAAIMGRIPAGRMGSARDVAAAAVFLASDEAAYVTGQTIHVNGGMALY